MTFVRPAVSSFRIRWWTYKRLWRTGALVSFVQPVFTMLALGVGVGGLIVNRTSLGGLNYATFIGPGLLVSSCMMTGAVEGMWMVLDAFQWNRLYHSQVASPLTPRDVVRGHALWIIVRVGIGAVMVAAALTVFPSTRSIGVLAAVPVAVGCGLAFGMPMAAYSATIERDVAFANINRFVLNPLYLFAGAFFPLAQLPTWLRSIVAVFPLWHAIELARGAMTSTAPAWPWLLHLSILAVWIVGGMQACFHTFTKRLAQ